MLKLKSRANRKVGLERARFIKTMKYFSLFSGIGGFEYGINKAFQYTSQNDRQPMGGLQSEGIKPLSKEGSGDGGRSLSLCVGFSEIDKYATQIYKKHFPEHKEYGDVSNIKWTDVPDFDLLVGGFPCQAFSIAGKRGGFDDTRGTLFFEIARAAQEKQPRILLLENVKGLLSHDKGRTFGTILNTLDELGYDCQWQVLNSKNFGVPQNRERVFIVGHLRGTSRPEVFPLQENSRQIDKDDKSQISGTVIALYGRNPTDGTYVKHTRVHNMQPRSPNRPSLKYSSGGSGHLSREDTAYCLDSGRTNAIEFEKARIRRLTPTECERLQGFPDGWTEYGLEKHSVYNKSYTTGFERKKIDLLKRVKLSDTQRYKCLGNAVTVNVIEVIMDKLL